MKIIICGACGRMGKNVAELAPSYGCTVVCGVDLSPAEAAFPVYDSFSKVSEQADALIDFSSSVNLDERLAFCEEKNICAVLGSTGYSEEDEKKIDAFAKKIPVFQSGNLSVGINLLQRLVKQAAQTLGAAFDAEIIERHHNQKKDAPSGTALMLAKSVNEGLGAQYEFTCGRKGLTGARNQKEIGIHAVRGGNIVGEHEVMFAGEDEIITLSHSARSRKVFAAGALKAAVWLTEKPAGRYDMSSLLDDIL